MAKAKSVVWVLCIGVVTVASFFSRKTGVCGTAHYLFFRLLGGVVVEAVTAVWQTQYERAIEQAAAIALNVGAFSLLMRLWHRKAPREWFVVGLIAWTALYVTSYFFFFPTRDCP